VSAIIVSAVQTDAFLQSVILQRPQEDDRMVEIGDVQAHILDKVVVHPCGVQSDRSVLMRDIQEANLNAASGICHRQVQ